MVDTFGDFAPKKIKLADIVVAYNDGIKWKVIPLSVMNQYPIIYDEYHENRSDVRVIVSIYVCPYTLYSCMYFGKYELHNNIVNNNLTIVNVDNNIWIVPILNQVHSLSTNNIIDMYIRKNEIKILSLKNVIYMFPDSLFVNVTKIPKKSKIVDKEYLIKTKTNDKQIIYVIEYKSKKQNEYKYTIIIPKNNDYDMAKNGFETYFHKMVEKIRIKGGIIHTCLLFAWQETKIPSKVINL
jgi:predicted transcriptional regulator